MSRENVSIVREAFAGADGEDAIELWHPEIEWVVAREHPNGRRSCPGRLRAHQSG